MTITADRFLEGVKRRNTLTENDVLLEDDDLLQIADDIIKGYIVPHMISVRGDYFVVTLEEATVEDQPNYNFPARAVGLTLRDLKLVVSDDDVRNLTQIPIEKEQEHRSSSTGIPWGYYFKNDEIILVQTPDSDDYTVEIWHEQHPSKLTLLENAAVVVSVASDVVTVESVPTVLVVGADVDFVRGRPGHRVMAMDKEITNISGTDITFATDDVPSTLAAGDYLSLAETSPVLQIPDLVHPLLETIVSKRATYSIGDFEARAVLSDDEKTELALVLKALEPRNRGEVKKIVNSNGLLRGRRGPGRRGFYG